MSKANVSDHLAECSGGDLSFIFVDQGYPCVG